MAAEQPSCTVPELAEALAAQEADDSMVDEEAVAFEAAVAASPGCSSGAARPSRGARRTRVAVYLYLFDVLHVEGTT